MDLIYITMDAGSNVKILYQKKDEDKVLEIFRNEYKGK